MDCQKCQLHELRRKVVLGRGTIPCEVLFVGEAPGESEDVLGKPFIGQAGKALDDTITKAVEDAGYRPTMAFTNLIGCIPRDTETRKKVNDPAPECIEACQMRLQSFTKLCKPQAIVMVGSLSQKWSPKMIDWDFQFSIDIIHPAAILRMAYMQAVFYEQKTCVQLRDLFIKVKNAKDSDS
jgi:uracil-DNA glycosylase family 4